MVCLCSLGLCFKELTALKFPHSAVGPQSERWKSSLFHHLQWNSALKNPFFLGDWRHHNCQGAFFFKGAASHDCGQPIQPLSMQRTEPWQGSAYPMFWVYQHLPQNQNPVEICQCKRCSYSLRWYHTRTVYAFGGICSWNSVFFKRRQLSKWQLTEGQIFNSRRKMPVEGMGTVQQSFKYTFPCKLP